MLKKIKKIEFQIDEYLDIILRGSLVFREAMPLFLKGRVEDFSQKLEEINKLESDADELRRAIEIKLYVNTLIPDHRGDVLGLIENTDKVMNSMAETLIEIEVEMPQIPAELVEYFTELSEKCVLSVESLVQAVRAYFKDVHNVRDHINKVMFYEKETDKIAIKIKRMIYDKPDIKLSQRINIKYFAKCIENIADIAEDVCDRLSIAVIKREF
jgi:uncharacterized protein